MFPGRWFLLIHVELAACALWRRRGPKAGHAIDIRVIFVARPLTVLACLLPDRRGRWTRNELIFLSWCRETGVIPAALAALLLSQNVPGAEIAVSLVALAVCVTLLLQATTAGPLARRLGLAEES